MPISTLRHKVIGFIATGDPLTTILCCH
ncbi:hypothetical protein [Salibacterium salarium]